MEFVFEVDLHCGEYEAITVSNSPIGFSESKYNPTTGQSANSNAKKIFCRVENSPIRFTLDGTTPTDTIGMLLDIGETLELRNLQQIKRFWAIKISNNASLKVFYFF